jgi:hypothetical protein
MRPRAWLQAADLAKLSSHGHERRQVLEQFRDAHVRS